MNELNFTEEYGITQFESLNWHDNKIHSIAFNTENNSLIFEIDYITKYENKKFFIAPAKLVFEAVSDLAINIDWSMCALEIMIHSIMRFHQRRTPNDQNDEWDWEIKIEWPKPGGSFKFTSMGFKMYCYCQPIECAEPKFTFAERIKILEEVMSNKS